MASQNGPSQDALSLLKTAMEEPRGVEFLFLARLLQLVRPQSPGSGVARRPSEEPCLFSQTPSLSFESGEVADIKIIEGDGRHQVNVFFFGLFGPYGPMPLHLTELLIKPNEISRKLPELLLSFGDIFNNRLLSLFYKAWELSDLAASADGAAHRHDHVDAHATYARYLGSLFGQGTQKEWKRDLWPDDAKRYFTQWLAQTRKTGEGFCAMVSEITGAPCDYEPFVGEWLVLPPADQLALGSGKRLGLDTFLGSKFWSRENRVSFTVGPMSLTDYRKMAEDGPVRLALRAAVRNYFGDGLRVTVKVSLKKEEVPQLGLNTACKIGLDTWLVSSMPDADPCDYSFGISICEGS